MANALFAGSPPTSDHSLIPTRKTSRANSTVSFLRRPSREGGTLTVSHVSPLIHVPFMNEAIVEARASLNEGGIPIGCVLVRNDQVIARGHNHRIQRNSVILHAELDCLESGGRRTAAFYRECTLYVTSSPCPMCAGALRLYGISRLVIGEDKNYQGDEHSLRTSHIQVDVLDSKECQQLLGDYIKANKIIWNEYLGKDEPTNVV